MSTPSEPSPLLSLDDAADIARLLDADESIAVAGDEDDADESVANLGFRAPRADRDHVDLLAGPGASRYGEITARGARDVLRRLAPRADDVLVDVGSGAGRFVLQAAACTPVGHVIGVELSRWRHLAATHNLERLCKRVSPCLAASLRARVEFQRADFRYVGLSDATLIWAGATCFPPTLIAELGRHIGSSARNLRRLLTTHPLDPGEAHAAELVLVDEFSAEMTWSAREAVHVYTRAEQGE